MKKHILCLILLSLFWTGTYAQSARRLFEFEQREGDTRPKPDLTPNAPSPMGKGPGVGSKAPGLSAAAKGAKAGWQPNGIVVCDTAPSALPKIVSDGNSGAIICWTECYRDQVNLDDDIYAQRVDSGGNFVWPNQGVPVCSLKGSYSNYPAMIADGKGGAIIAWEDSRGGLGYTRVFAQRLDSLGNRVWPENGVLVCNQMSGYVELCSDGHGGAIIVYSDGRNQAVTSDDIYAQRIDSAGNPVWAIDGVPVCTADSIQFWPQIVNDKLGGAVITWWQDYRNSSNNNDVYAQRMDSQGLVKWTVNGLGVCIEPGNQGGGQLCENNKGGAIIRWGDGSSSRVQSLDSTGFKLWDSNGVNTLGTYGIIKEIIFGGGVSNSYAAQRIDSIGNIKWGIGILLHGDTTGGQFGANADSFGNLFVIWDELRTSPFYTNQYAQKVDINGNILWGDSGVAVCKLQMEYETYPQITIDGLGGAICTWFGNPIHSDNHIYAQRVNANGIPGGVTGEPVEENRPVKLFMNIFPNPSKGRTEVEFSLAKPAFIELAVYNMLGQRVRTLVNSYKNAGRHKISWNGRDNAGNEVSSGVYFYRLKAGEHNAAKKMMVIK